MSSYIFFFILAGAGTTNTAAVANEVQAYVLGSSSGRLDLSMIDVCNS